MTTIDKIKSVLSQVLDLPEDQIADGFSSDDSEAWSSLTHLTVILCLESEFGVQFSDQEAVELQSVGNIRAALRARGIE